MKHGSLFSGIGGFDLAAEWMGWENVFHCEWNEFGQKVLKHYWPKAISYEDITKTDFTIHRGNIDILTGGFPCQPYSAAGKRRGKEDERHLWPQMLRAIREIAPRWVVGENVRGLVNWNGGMVFEEVCADLENLGYQVTAFLIPACATNAPHKRERIWIVAKNTISDGCLCGESKEKRAEIWKQRDTCTGSINRIHLSEGYSTNPNNTRTDIGMPSQRERQEGYSIGGLTQPELGQTGRNGDAADTMCKGLEWSEERRGIGEIREESHEFSTRCFRSKWEKFPSVSPVCVRDDGFSDRLDGITFPKWRNESIKAGGNAVVPQVVFQIFKTIEQYEILNNVNNPAH